MCKHYCIFLECKGYHWKCSTFICSYHSGQQGAEYHHIPVSSTAKHVSPVSTQLATKAQSSQNDLLGFNLTNEIVLLLPSSGKKLNINIALGKKSFHKPRPDLTLPGLR